MAIEFHRDGPWAIPEEWVWARLGDVARVNPSTSFDALPAELEIPFVPMAAMAEETGVVDLSQRRSIAQLMKGYTRFQTGDVLFAKITPCMENGKSAPINDLPSGYGAGSTEFHVIRSRLLYPRYLWYWLVRRAFRGDAERNMSGSAGQMRVPVDYLRDTQIAIPPTAEQGRIVARIDELLTDIADGETALTRARDDLDTWRRALLKAAVTGELTREWREHNKPNETAFDFLTHIREARSDRGDNRNRVAPPAFDTSDLPELPEGWSWSALPALCVAAQRNGISIKGTPSPPGVMALRLDALTDHGLNFGAVRYIPLAAERLPNYLVKKHDFLVSRANGSEELVGRAVYVANIVQETVFPDTIIRYPLYPSEVLGRWIELAWRSPLTRRQIGLKSKSTAGILKISQDDIAQIAIPIPPEVEMRAAIDAFLLNAENSIEGVGFITSSVRDAMALRQSILKAAFEGRLVEQDPSDEPAERLLARLNDSALQSIPASGRRARRVRDTVGADA
jgi:type I restriction enzyme S subunit